MIKILFVTAIFAEIKFPLEPQRLFDISRWNFTPHLRQSPRKEPNMTDDPRPETELLQFVRTVQKDPCVGNI